MEYILKSIQRIGSKVLHFFKRKCVVEGSPEGHCEGADWSSCGPPVRAALLGAPGVGKTSIAQQFFEHQFSLRHTSTAVRRLHRAWTALDGRPIELLVTDLPPFVEFPADTLDEWERFRCGAVRSADIYVLIFDVSDVRRTFNCVRELYRQLSATRDPKDYAVIVVGNKQDLLTSDGGPQELRDAVTLIRKNWKTTYVECSARYNYHIAALFRLVAGGPESLQRGGVGADGRQGLRRDRRGKCALL